MSNVRAKFTLTKIEQTSYSPAVKFTFSPVYDPAIPEDQVFAQYSPSGEFWINVTNPAVIEGWKLGESYYLDFTPVPVAGPVAA